MVALAVGARLRASVAVGRYGQRSAPRLADTPRSPRKRTRSSRPILVQRWSWVHPVPSQTRNGWPHTPASSGSVAGGRDTCGCDSVGVLGRKGRAYLACPLCSGPARRQATPPLRKLPLTLSLPAPPCLALCNRCIARPVTFFFKNRATNPHGSIGRSDG